MCVCVCVCVTVCVCLGGEGSERISNKIKCEKEKGKEGERCLSASGRVCMVYDHVYSMLFVQGNSIPINKMLTKYRLHKSCGC